MIIQINELHDFDIHNIKLKKTPKKKKKINIDIQNLKKKKKAKVVKPSILVIN